MDRKHCTTLGHSLQDILLSIQKEPEEPQHQPNEPKSQIISPKYSISNRSSNMCIRACCICTLLIVYHHRIQLAHLFSVIFCCVRLSFAHSFNRSNICCSEMNVLVFWFFFVAVAYAMHVEWAIRGQMRAVDMHPNGANVFGYVLLGSTLQTNACCSCLLAAYREFFPYSFACFLMHQKKGSNVLLSDAYTMRLLLRAPCSRRVFPLLSFVIRVLFVISHLPARNDSTICHQIFQSFSFIKMLWWI